MSSLIDEFVKNNTPLFQKLSNRNGYFFNLSMDEGLRLDPLDQERR